MGAVTDHDHVVLITGVEAHVDDPHIMVVGDAGPTGMRLETLFM